MADFPWFPLYPGDWISSETTQLMTVEEEGGFFRLCCFAWLSDACALSSNAQALLKLAKWPEGKDFTRVLACFHPHPTEPDKLCNPRLYAEWQRATAEAEMKQSRAVAGAEARWGPKKLQLIKKEQPLSNGRDYRAEAQTLLTFLNEKTGKKFRPIQTNLAWIEARLKSGVELQTCKTLIARKCHDWLTDPTMMPYLRPETLFNKTKFESYLAEVTT